MVLETFIFLAPIWACSRNLAIFVSTVTLPRLCLRPVVSLGVTCSAELSERRRRRKRQASEAITSQITLQWTQMWLVNGEHTLHIHHAIASPVTCQTLTLPKDRSVAITPATSKHSSRALYFSLSLSLYVQAHIICLARSLSPSRPCEASCFSSAAGHVVSGRG